MCQAQHASPLFLEWNVIPKCYGDSTTHLESPHLDVGSGLTPVREDHDVKVIVVDCCRTGAGYLGAQVL